MKKLFNFRSFVYSAIFLGFSVIACLLALNIAWLGLFLLLCIIFVPPIMAIIFWKRIAKYKIVTIFMSSFLSIISSIAFFIKVYTWIPDEIMHNKSYNIEGTIEDCYVSNDIKVVILKDLNIDDRKVSGNLQLAIYGDNSFDDSYIGYKVNYTDTLQFNTLVSDFNVNSFVLRNDIRYLSSANINELEITSHIPDFLSRVNLFIKHKLFDNMGEESGAIAYGILTGNKNDISEGVGEAFSIAGVAHILAVSGLHIGFLMSLILFILRKLKVKRIPSFIITALILLLYAFLAGFSPSVTRAVIMCLVGGGAMVLGEQKDGFNALGVAITLILTFAPFMLFDVGFVMSVGSVFAIINFTPIFNRGLKKLEMPNKLCNAVSVSTSAQLGILPPSICFFGSLQTYSILINIVLMPLMSLSFMATFVLLLISLIPPLEFVLSFSGSLIQLLSAATSFFASLPFAQISIQKSPIVMLFYLYYFMIGDFFCFKHKKFFAIIGGILAFLIVVFLALA